MCLFPKIQVLSRKRSFRRFFVNLPKKTALYELEIFDFPSDFLDDVEVFDFVSREDFYCHFVIGDLVVGEFHFSECAGAQGGVENVVADSNDSFGHGGLLLKRVF